MDTDHSDQGLIRSDVTLFSIIEHLMEENGTTVTAIANELELAKSGIHKHLKTMEEYGYVVKRDEEYQLGLQFFNRGIYTRTQYEIPQTVRSLIGEIADQTNESAWCIVPEGGQGMVLYGASENDSISPDSLIGSWLPLHANSGGKAIMAQLPQSEIDAILDQHGLPAKTQSTITDRDDLLDELDHVQEAGYALNFGEDIEGIHAVGVPVVIEDDVLGALTIAGAANRLTEEYCKTELVPLLKSAVDDLELSYIYG
ncbi:IclR family transcriptional regulator [Halalkalicoccus salilacus]|uniref:IclR family transcriptional regulator n=1 Tax=Halalkalicoccus salilacus TaxID=3117459 RepID=UPI00300ED963